MKASPRPSDLDHLNWLNTKVTRSWQSYRVVDLGCGSGYLCEWLKSQGGSDVVGIDLETPPTFSRDSQWKFGQVDLDNLWDIDVRNMLDGHRADYILAFDIIEHLNSPWNFLIRCRNLLKPGGTLVLTTPNINSWERFLNPTNWSGAKDSQHKILFAKYSLSFVLTKAGFTVETLEAPLRSAKRLSSFVPNIGGQIFSVSKLK
jgi:2-polyprenyl-3-methyl-5-hydroxy-6-metoxy-1,4-benzoquinol methylase